MNKDLKIDEQTLEAILAHELGHHKRYKEIGISKYLKLVSQLLFKTKIYDTIRTTEEHFADGAAIKAGCRAGLEKLLQFNSQKEGYSSRAKYYFDLEQIQSFQI